MHVRSNTLFCPIFCPLIRYSSNVFLDTPTISQSIVTNTRFRSGSIFSVFTITGTIPRSSYLLLQIFYTRKYKYLPCLLSRHVQIFHRNNLSLDSSHSYHSRFLCTEDHWVAKSKKQVVFILKR